VSQQEIQFENTEQSESKRYDSGYGAFPHYSNNDYEFIPIQPKDRRAKRNKLLVKVPILENIGSIYAWVWLSPHCYSG